MNFFHTVSFFPGRLIACLALALTWGTATNAQYCSPSSNFNCSFGDDIGNFSTTGGLTQNISNLGSGCSTGGYSYTPASTMTVDAAPNGTINFSVSTGGSFSQGFRIWVDWNNDNDFQDPGEDMWNSSSWGTGTFSGSMTVPSTANGVHRMRVRGSWNSLPTDPCANQTYGEVEDYEISIAVPPANDAGVSALINPPAVACSLGTTVEVEITNYGTATLSSAVVNWTYNNFTQSPVTWTGSLVQGETDTVLLSSNFTYSVGGNMDFWTTLPNNVPDSAGQNDSLITTVQPLSLSGTYTINSSVTTGGSNFNSFSDAVSAMTTVGICDTVILNVANGNYAEQVELGPVPGAGPNAAVIFRGSATNNTLANLSNTSTSSTANYTLRLNGAQYIGFEDMSISALGTTYGRVVEFMGGSHNNWFTNCNLNGRQNVSTTSTHHAVLYASSASNHDNTFDNCSFSDGSYSVYWRGGSTTDLNDNTVFRDCEFTDWYYMGTYAWFNNDMTIEGCSYETNSSYTAATYGMYIWYSDGAQRIVGNEIRKTTSGKPRYGMYLVNCDASNTQKGLIANNMVVVGDSGSTSEFFTLYLSNSGFQQVVHNTLVAFGGTTTSRTLYIPSGGANTVVNNNIVQYGTGTAFYLSSAFAVSQADNNNLYAPNGDVGFLNTAHTTLNDWQSVTGFDPGSFSVDPIFADWPNNDLHTCGFDLNGSGQDLNGLVLDDFDGDTRNQSAPDIGADEFQAANDFAFASDSAILCSGTSLTLTGAPGLQNLWSNGATTSSVQVNAPGLVSVTMSNSCGGFTDTVAVVASSLTASATTSANVTCNGFSNGAVSGSATGGEAPYSYLWSTGAATTTVSGLGAATYTVTVTDALGCTASASTTVTEPMALSVSNAVTSAISCAGQSDGVVTASGSGGTTPYSYAWNTGGSSASLSGLASGVYTVTLTDGNGCTGVSAIFLTEPTTLAGTTAVTSAVDCNGGTNGSATILLTGGTMPYTYAWSNSSSMANLSGVGAGTYTVTVTDAGGCTLTGSVTLTEPSALTVNATVIDDVSCNGGNDGEALATGAGGTAPYVYAWSGGGTGSSTTGLAAGTYTVTCTDDNGCTAAGTVTIAEPAALAATVNTTQVTCTGGFDGSASTVVSGGTAPYFYNWSGTGLAGSTLSGLTAGTYSVTVTDANNCTATGLGLVGAGAALPTPNLGPNDNFCIGDSYQLNGGGGVIGYLWSTGSTGSSITVSNPGTYWVEVTDVVGCTNRDSITLGNWPDFTLALATQDVDCQFEEDGELTVTPTGGTAPFSYLWDDPANQTTATATNLAAGSYSVLVTDDNGCSQNVSGSVSFLFPQPVVDLGPASDVICETYDYTINPTGGFASYLWSTGATTSSIVVSTAGNYVVTATDVNGCVASDSISLTVDPCVGIAGLQDDVSISYFPNPTDGLVDLQLEGLEGETIEVAIYTAQGRLVQQHHFEGLSADFRQRFDLTGEARGLYLVKVMAGERTFVDRIAVN